MIQFEIAKKIVSCVFLWVAGGWSFSSSVREKKLNRQLKKISVVRRLTVGPTGRWNDGAEKPARDSNPESPDV